MLYGTPGTVVGFPDVNNRKVLIQVLLTLPGASTPTEVLHEVYPRNIMLTSEFEEQNNTPAPPRAFRTTMERPRTRRRLGNGESRTGCSKTAKRIRSSW